MKRTVIGFSAVLICLTLAAQETPRPAGGGLADRFKQFDKDGDGKLTRAEFPAAKIFEAADADKDGLLTTNELKSHFQKQTGTPATPPKPAPAPASPAQVEIVQTLDVPYATIAGVDPKFLSLDIHAPKGIE
jgi:hypothetical protein